MTNAGLFNRPSNILRPALITLLGVLMATSAFADASGPKAAQSPETAPYFGFPVTVEASAECELLEKSSLVPSGLVRRGKLNLPLFVPLSDNWRMIGGLSGKTAEYESTPFSPDKLRIWEAGGFLSVEADFTARWTAALGGFSSVNFEEGADLGDSLNLGALTSVSYKWSRNLQTSVGALYLNLPTGDGLVVPTIGLEWQLSDEVLVSIRGLEGRVQRRITDRVDIYWRGEWEPYGARLKRRSNTQAISVSDVSVRTGLGIVWHPSRGWTVTLDGGVAFHTIELQDATNRRIAKDQLDPAPYVGLAISAQF